MSLHDSKATSMLPGLPLPQADQDLQRYFSRRLANRQDVRELTQEVWLRLCRVPDRQRLREPMAYVYRTAANVLAEFFLRRRREAVTLETARSDLCASQASQAFRDEQYEQTQAQHDLLEALKGLPQAFRSIVWMRLCEQQSFAQIGAKCGFTEATTRRYYFRAIKTLWKSEWE